MKRLTPRAGDTPIEAVLRLRLRQLREAAGRGVNELARAAGVHPQTVSNIECGRYSASLATVQALADALGVSPLALLTPE